MRRILSLLALLFVFSGLPAQQQIRFENMDINNGLSQSLVNDIIQDRKGFIWIATQDGLNRYDGSNIVIYKKDPSNPNTLSNNFIQCLFEDKDGFIWLGTNSGGLNRFDPRTEEFKRYELGDQYRNVTDIAEDSKGNIWFTTFGNGINLFDKQKERVTTYVFKGVEARNVLCVYVDEKDRVLAGTSGKGLLMFNAKHQRFDAIDDPNINEVVWSITKDQSGNFWIGTNTGIVRLRLEHDGYFTERYLAHHDATNSLSNNTVRNIYVTKSGAIIVCTTGSGIDIMQLKNERPVFHNFRHNDFQKYSLADDLVLCALEDRSGSIWIGTNQGISRFDPIKQVFSQITASIDNPKSLNDRTVWSICEDKQGVLWVGTRQGLNRVDRKNGRIDRYNRIANNPNSQNNNSVLSLYIDDEGTIWVGAVDGLFTLGVSADFTTASFRPVPFRNGSTDYSDNRVYSIQEDKKKNILWVGTKEGLSRIDKKTGNFQFFQNNPNDPNSLPSSKIRLIFIDSRGNTWVSCEGEGLSQIIEEKNGENTTYRFVPKQQAFNASTEEGDMLITSMWEDEKGLFWCGTYGSGLLCYDPVDDRVVKSYNERQGLSNNVVYSVLGDANGALWMSTNYGLNRFDLKTEKFAKYLEKDGLQSNEFNIGAAFKSRTGELFFGGIDGFNSFFPDQLKTNTVAPEVVITEISLFNKVLRAGKGSQIKENVAFLRELNLGYRENTLTINFAALHFSNPANNRYRYMMEGLDDQIIESGTNHTANYNRIPPGKYTFKVWACNSDGYWSEKPTELIVIIHPPFWATWWFRTLVIFLILGLVLAIYQARIVNIKKQRLRLALEVRERTREVMEQKEKIETQKQVIEEEKNKVEKLLLNILPEETAEELKSRGKASARSYRQVTVLFTDFVGFTKIAERMRPSDLVAKLDNYFVQFDEIIQKYNLEKIKTIGDSYMAAGGVPIRSKSNPIDTVLAALEIQRYMMELRKQSDDPDEAWELRIGINTGEIIAGVIGTKRFAYDIWGNTVNTANRMQVTADPMTVNISGTTYDLIEPYFECTYRGKIAAKNKGEIDMYFVHRIKPELSVDGLGIEPNEKFWKYVDLHLYSSINYNKAERHIMKILRERLPKHLYYHGIHHTYDVVQAAERLALMEGITDEQMFTLKSAATYHDAGFVEQYDKNEPVGIRMAQEILPKYGYTPDQVDEVARLIRATIIPHAPQSPLEEIICDADLDYLGRDDFHEIADTLRRELREAGKISSDRAWDEMQVKFLTMHKYFTKSAIQLRQAKKEKHVEEIKQRLDENNYAD